MKIVAFALVALGQLASLCSATGTSCDTCTVYKGNIDHRAIGNSLNYREDRLDCGKKDSSSEWLRLPAGASVVKAYLYWSGIGS